MPSEGISRLVLGRGPRHSLTAALDEIQAVTGSSVVLLLQRSPALNALVLEGALGYSEEELLKLPPIPMVDRSGPGTSVAVRSLLDGKAVLMSSDCLEYMKIAEGVEEILAVPITSRPGAEAVLVLERRSHDDPLPAPTGDSKMLAHVSAVAQVGEALAGDVTLAFDEFLRRNRIDWSTSANLDACTEWLQEHCGFDFCCIYLRSRGSAVSVAAASGSGKILTADLRSVSYELTEDVVGWVARNRLPIFLPDAAATDSPASRWYESLGAPPPVWNPRKGRHPGYLYSAAPLMDGSRVLGVLRFSDDRSAISDSRRVAILPPRVLNALAADLASLIAHGYRQARPVAAFAAVPERLPVRKFPDVIQESLASLLKLTNATDAVLLLRRELEDEVMFVSWVDRPQETSEVTDPTQPGTLLADIMDGAVVRGTATNEDPIVLFLGESLGYGYSYFGVPVRTPLVSDGPLVTIGAVIASSPIEKAFNEDDEYVITAIADKVVDSFLIIQYEMAADKVFNENEQLRLAASSGGLAAAEIHDLRHKLVDLAPHVTAMVKHKAVKSNRVLLKHARRARDVLEEVKASTRDFLQGLHSPQGKPVPVSVDEVIQGTLDQMYNLTHVRSVSISRSLHAAAGRCCVDPSRLRQVFRNVLTNALEANARKVAIRSSVDRGAEAIVVTISDDGVGIPEDSREIIFKPLKTIGKKGGTGLGLFNSRAILRLYGGKIGVVSPPSGKTTAFRITLPILGEDDKCPE